MTENDTADRLRTEREYAEYRRSSTRTIQRERADGTGCPFIRIGSRIFYLQADIDQFVDAHRVSKLEPENRHSANEDPIAPKRAPTTVRRTAPPRKAKHPATVLP
jgi:hypothetical protein